MNMKGPQDILISEYDYCLPDECIAKYPLAERDQCKLLVYDGYEIRESIFGDITRFLPKNSMLVFNDTKVIHARVLFKKPSGANIEVFCLEPYESSISSAFEQRECCAWVCFVGNNKRWKEDQLEKTIMIGGVQERLTVKRLCPSGNAWVVLFSWTGGHSFAELIENAGQIPLPPYLNRQAEADDDESYQTVYARHMGSVAAPTAGLHFTDKVLHDVREREIKTEFLTLHVGAGTFKPVSSETIGGHEMHSEKIVVTKSAIENITNHVGKPIIAVGTTSVRTLESIYWFGVSLGKDANQHFMKVSQWEPYQDGGVKMSVSESYQNVLKWLDRTGQDVLLGDTQLMIAPSYTYRVIDGLITNFHQPQSTLLLLVAALIGDSWKDCYSYALDNGFRFLSYGDCCFFTPKQK